MRLDFFRIFVVILLAVIAFGIYSDKKPEGFYTEQVGGFLRTLGEGMSEMFHDLGAGYVRGSEAFRLASICAFLVVIVAIAKILARNNDDPDP